MLLSMVEEGTWARSPTRLQGGRRAGDRERSPVARGPCAYRKELQDPWELELATFPEKSIDAVAPSNAFVCELEGTCVNEPDLRFNIPKNMEESKVKFEHKPHCAIKRKQEQQDEGHGEQDAFGKLMS